MTTEKVLLIDPNNCCGCGRCEYACSFSNEGVFNLSLSRLRLTTFPDNVISLPVVCQQCKLPLCMFACPTNAIRKNSETGVVSIDSDICIGCLQCFLACPLGGISVTNEHLPIKCDLCNGEPKCVLACNYNALMYMDINQANSYKKKKGVGEILLILDTSD
jgi:anaerobic carbon-monoxide dehydrogenase iron sulfur subunit